ncbi:MAG: hypothetical protein ACD_30C00005G0030 [uncultured bacterium]|uniref:Copper-sensing transcriptional repressor CsoR n=4 Tax=Candidatus Daviesiibacteriota TaxID=1752718 RepID=A0A0G0EP38_9BACT|nr:MAG: hypothetical protein ACD_30C00005G0030 [uncultured bacterium]KKQ08738.1 MAG: hypothetical protein US19_C0020G0027 [Candidatus Daviesbacteria bacterium GW2011_GWB1_36_5]KKQ15894.1 MAG: hypothetical protein US28_C0008G0026 [Candidatus Daviesbacteria bacterium GW2011_GWA1_36_8]OGE16655.1 MAG: hypothetical protein A2858_02320 [Candidatus Daviesbacteria bacterium RIFCSPHIGHO2_01_FULL_36_37]OGE33386.1 MAG: hypothetical protein A3C99_01710 [Candidatus Daviesbacteria bacterium RIFCSPHIGHO2_02_F
MAYRPKDLQERILHRLKISRGHLNKVINMIESDEYCIDVLTQSQAVQKAIKETDALILENHLKGCVVDHIQRGETKATIDEIMKIFRKQ